MAIARLYTFLFFTIGFSLNSFGKSLKFDDKNHNFGNVTRGEILSWQVGFENKGNTDVRIQGVYSGCGCTAVELEEDKVYRPGQKGSILVKFDTTNFVGHVSKQIIVITSEKRNSQNNLNLKANIKEEFRISPPLLDFGLVKANGKAQRKFKVEPIGGFKLEVEDIEYNSDRFNLESVKTGSVWDVTLTLKEGISAGFYRDTLLVETNSEVLSKVKVPVRFEIENQINFSPNYVEFGVVDKQKSKSKKISLEANEAFSIVSSDVIVHVNSQLKKDYSEMVKVVLSKEPTKSKMIEVVITNDRELSGSVHGKVILESTFSNHKNVIFDFYAFFK